jgi:hypothetical protein
VRRAQTVKWPRFLSPIGQPNFPSSHITFAKEQSTAGSMGQGNDENINSVLIVLVGTDRWS